MDDTEIVELYLQRDETALSQTQGKYGKRLCAVSHAITGDRLTAEEVENDTYLKAWESIPPNAPYKALFAYLAKIARNLSINACKSRGRLKRAAMIVELSDEMEQCIPAKCRVEEDFDAKLLSECISVFLDALHERKRDIFMRRYWYLDTPQSIAERFGMSENNVKVTLFRLREKLREHLENEGFFVR